MKIMIVDDERDVEILFRQQFRKEVKDGRVELCYAFSGEEALEYLQTVNPPDVVCILSDINMPGITGLDLLKAVKEKYPDIRVSMITAYGDEHQLQDRHVDRCRALFHETDRLRPGQEGTS